MLRRLALSAALAALTVPVTVSLALSGAAHADPGSTPTDDPAAQTLLRKQRVTATVRKPVASRRANRARAEDDAPLSVSIDQLTPSTIPSSGVIRVSGFVTNNDTVPWTTINVRPFISATPLTSATQLSAAAAMPADAVVGDRINDEKYKDFIPELDPGASLPYTITVPRKLLDVSTPGVYWFGVHALGEGPEGRDDTADGRARTFLPLVPPSRPGEEPAAVVIPLRHQLLYTDDGSVDDLPDWIQTLSQGGRLRSLVDFGASSGARTVTWVVDPALVDAVRRLAAGNPPRSLAATLQPGQASGTDQGDQGDQTDESPGQSASATPTASDTPTGSPTANPEDTGSPLDLTKLDPVVQAAAKAAQAWLNRLTNAIRPDDQVLSLPYGDIDASAAAARDPQLYQRAVARAGTSLPGIDVTTSPVLSSPSGYLSSEGIAAAVPNSTILVTDQMFGSPAPALARTDGHDVVVTSTGAASGGPGPDSPTALIAMRQRLLAEAAVRFLRDGHAPLTLMLPPDWIPPADGTSFFGGLDTPWLDLTSVAAVIRSADPTPVDGATLHYPQWQRDSELDQASFDTAESLIRSGVALQNLLTLNNQVAGTVTDQALGSTSYSARSRPFDNRAAADRARSWIDSRLGQVHVTAPRAVTLSSSSGRFQAVIDNTLDQPVTVQLTARADRKVTIDGPRRVEVPANQRQAVLLTVHTSENGIHEVTLVVTDKRGTPLGATTALTIRSAQVSNVIWLFLGIGLALFLGAITVRVYRRVRGSRRTPTDPDPDTEAKTGDAGSGPAGASGQKEPAGAGTR